MNLYTTILFYLLFGVATAVAQFCTVSERTSVMRFFESAIAVLFWPLFLPQLIRPDRHQMCQVGAEADLDQDNSLRLCNDELFTAIELVEQELATSLRPISGASLNVLDSERRRFQQLREAWRLQAKRIHELDRVLETPSFELPTSPIPAERDLVTCSANPVSVRHSEEVRRDNLHLLRLLRERARSDLLTTLERVRELVTMIHLAKFTGAPSTRSAELLTQIELAVRELPKSFETC